MLGLHRTRNVRDASVIDCPERLGVYNADNERDRGVILFKDMDLGRLRIEQMRYEHCSGSSATG